MLYEKYISIKTAAEAFDMTEAAIRGMIARREIPHLKLGTRVRLRHRDLKVKMRYFPSKDEVGFDVFEHWEGIELP